MKDEKFDVVVDGKAVLTLNSRLAKIQCVSEEQIRNLKYLHYEKYKLFEQCKVQTDVNLLRMLAAMLELIEYELQRNWNFPLNKNFHKFWNIPGCSCPKMDNEDAFPTGYYVHSDSCLIHSSVN